MLGVGHHLNLGWIISFSQSCSLARLVSRLLHNRYRRYGYMVQKKILTALSAALIVSMLATGVVVATQGKTTLEVAKTAGDKKVEVIKA